MQTKIGFLGVAHMHAYGYAHGLRGQKDAAIAGVYDANPELASRFGLEFGAPTFDRPDALFEASDAIVICSENLAHAEHVEQTAAAGKPILCEKPLAASEEQGRRILQAVESTRVPLMTAFPCRFSPAFLKARDRVIAGDIGRVEAICATNRGSCPFGWFVEVDQSGGGAMIDHVVHVADLLRLLLGEEPMRVQAQIGNRMYGKDWDDTAMLTIDFPSGVFATLDSSWSRPKSYKTWGDVTMNIVGTDGVVELDLFGWGGDLYRNESMRHSMVGFGSNLDALLMDSFLATVRGERPAAPDVRDGLQASRVSLAGYESVRLGGAPVLLD